MIYLTMKYMLRRISFIVFLSLMVTAAVKAGTRDGESALQLVRKYVECLEAYVKTGDISYRIQLDKITPANCLVNDVIAQRISKDFNYPAGTLRVADYYNAFERWRQHEKEGGVIYLSVESLEYLQDITEPGGAGLFSEPLEVVQGSLSLHVPGSAEFGVKAFDLYARVMYFVRGKKITKVISTGDGETLAKGIELYSKGEYDNAFSLFRELANKDMSDYMAQYWTASMLLDGKGCGHINEKVRRQEAMWWLTRGRVLCKRLIEGEMGYRKKYKDSSFSIGSRDGKAWKKRGHRPGQSQQVSASESQNTKNAIDSYIRFVTEWGEYCLDNVFPEYIKLMVNAYNEADITSREFPYGTQYFYYVAQEKRPMVNGLIPVFDPDTKLCGYLNEAGRTVIPYKYQSALPFNENGLALVWDDFDKGGFINAAGEVVIPCEYDFIDESFIGDVTFAVKGGSLYVISSKNEVVKRIDGYSELQYLNLDQYVLIPNPRTGKYDMYDSKGEVVMSDIDEGRAPDNERCEVVKGGEVVYSCYKNWK